MNHPSFIEQYDKLTAAYIRGEVKPNNNCACFIGNLLNQTGAWALGRTLHTALFLDDASIKTECRLLTKPFPRAMMHNSLLYESGGFYIPTDIVRLEQLFLNIYYKRQGAAIDLTHIDEDALFDAFEKTLDLLRRIHIEHGEDVDAAPVFKKREPVLVK